MPEKENSKLTSPKPLRLWPGVVAVVLQWLIKALVPIVAPSATMFAVLSGIALGLVVLLWWLFFSRAPWAERIGVIVLMVVGLLATSRVVDPSIAGGMMGMLLPVYAIPVLSLALVVSVVASRNLSARSRRFVISGAILLACVAFTLVRTGGLAMETGSDFHWRWTPTPEQRMLAQSSAERISTPAPPARIAESTTNIATRAEEKAQFDWPGFRGPNRDSLVPGVRIETNWSQATPVELWRKPVGPGWSSFAVHDHFIYTQEQRGDDEDVSCYNLTNGAPVWRHGDAARFWESNAGAGPRATPTFSRGRIYALGATGILNALDARDGSVVWSRNAASDTHKKIPGWGFASSPLVVDDLVIVATAGILAAYDRDTGSPRWIGPPGGWGYSSPHLATIDGVVQIILLNGAGAVSVAPADGKVLWAYSWKSDGMVQPALIAERDVLIGSGSGMGGGMGVRRISVTHAAAGWNVEERWTSIGLKPYFNDFVIHHGHAFGFDGSLLACIDLADGKRKWKGGRYGYGQLLGLPDQDLLLVLSESGELALVAANSEQLTELAHFAAMKGKTWNHPVLAGEILLVRNSEEMAAYRLSLERR
jgi:outer membrane protein assembly factor BamB